MKLPGDHGTFLGQCLLLFLCNLSFQENGRCQLVAKGFQQAAVGFRQTLCSGIPDLQCAEELPGRPDWKKKPAAVVILQRQFIVYLRFDQAGVTVVITTIEGTFWAGCRDSLNRLGRLLVMQEETNRADAKELLKFLKHGYRPMTEVMLGEQVAACGVQ